MQIWGQIIGLVAMVANILSYQCKSSRRLVAVMGVGALLFSVSYFLLGQPIAAMFNIIAVISSIASLKDNLKNKFIFAIIVILYATTTGVTFNGWWSLVLMVAQIAYSYSVMFTSGTFIRYMRFFFISPVWLINNTVICFTIGGIICEIITMTSIIVSFIRYRKTGFEK